MANRIIADMFEEIAEMLSLEEKPNIVFEVRAYRKAALTISTWQEDVEEIYRREGIAGLMKLPGIGKGIAGSIEEYVTKGKMSKYEMLKRKYPIDMKSLTRIEGVGARKAIALYKSLGIKDIAGLKRALAKHSISKLPGFGERSEELIAKGLSVAEASRGRMLLGDALPVAEALVRKLKESGLVETAMVAGSSRRMRETVGDIDILALSDDGKKAMDYFIMLPEIADVIAKGPTKTSARLKIGINCDLRIIPPESFGAALQYFTGSKDHNVQVRTIAVGRKYKLNEYGLFDGKGRIIPTKDEEEIYKKLGMQYVPPEMREARGEVKLARAGSLPDVVGIQDIKGDMHTHTNDSDGADSIEEMAKAAMSMGYQYFATTNHTKSLGIARGMDENGFKGFFRNVDRLNDKLDGRIRILKGAEIDILKDGSLDLSNECIRGMDFAIGAIHSYFKMGEKDMTDRIVKAIDTGLLHALAHPTGRELGSREPYAVNLERVFEAAERNKVSLEINAFPQRLDLNDTNIMKASGYKVMFHIGTDAHRTSHFALMRYGVGTARRGWLQSGRVINAMPLQRLAKALER